LHPHENIGLATSETTLGTLLQGAGYATACFGKWHLGHHEPFLPHHHGFHDTLVIPYSHDMYRGAPWGNAAFTQTWPDHVPLFRRGEKVAELRGLRDFATLTKRFTDSACDFIQQHSDAPFFLYLPYTLPHLELEAPGEWRGRSKRGPYGDAVAELDHSVGRILATLRHRGLEENTLVVFTSDNGPARIYQKPSFAGGSSGALSGGKNTAFEGGFRVPCLMRWPKQIPAARTCSAPCSVMDFLPTMASLSGGALPTAPIDGRNLLPLLRNPDHAASPHAGLLYHKDETPVAVRGGDYKLWLPNTAVNPTERPQLYHLPSDPAEQRDLSSQKPEEILRLNELAKSLAVPPDQVRKAAAIGKPKLKR
jgi:arylsulfatase A-like enzyme